MAELKIAEELKSIIKNIEKNVYYCDLTGINAKMDPGAWRQATNELTTQVLPRGRYLVIAGATYSAGVTSIGIATTRVIFDGGELGMGSRQTIPIGSATMTSNSVNVINIGGDSDTTHTISLQVYPLLQSIGACTWGRVILVKI